MYLDIFTADEPKPGAVYASRRMQGGKIWHCLVTEEQLEALRKAGALYKVVDEVLQGGKTPEHVFNPSGLECERSDKTRVTFSLATAKLEEKSVEEVRKP